MGHKSDYTFLKICCKNGGFVRQKILPCFTFFHRIYLVAGKEHCDILMHCNNWYTSHCRVSQGFRDFQDHKDQKESLALPAGKDKRANHRGAEMESKVKRFV